MAGIPVPERYKQALTKHHALVFFLTFFSYVFIHAARKTFSNVKTALAETWTLLPLNETIFANSSEISNPDRDAFFETVAEAEFFFGILDTAFLVSYAAGLFLSGFIGDRIDLRLVLSVGMCTSAMMMFLFGTVSEWVHVYNHWYYLVFWVLNGLLQGTGWPTLIAIMGSWFTERSRGLVFGIWSACGSVGNIVGAFCASLVLVYGYEFAFLATALMMFSWGLVVFFFLAPTPADAGLVLATDDDLEGESESEDETDLSKPEDEKPFANREELNIWKETTSSADDDDDDNGDHGKRAPGDMNDGDDDDDGEGDNDDTTDDEKKSTSRPEAIGFCQAFLLPGVVCYSLGYACLKLVNYSLFSWIPYYLSSRFHWSEVAADQLSMAYDIGGIIGGSIGGAISDYMGIRSPVVIVMLFGSMASLYGYNITPANYALNAFVMALVGAFVCGVSHIISGTVAADLGQRRDKEALATVTGIVDGTGTIGAAIGQVVIPILNIRYGWYSVFAFLIIMTAACIVFITPILFREIHPRFPCSRNTST